MATIKKVQETELLGLGAKAEDISRLTSAEADKLILELKAKAEPKKQDYSLQGRYKHLTKGSINSPHLLRGKMDIATLISRPEFYLRNEAVRYLKDLARNTEGVVGIYPLLNAFGISKKEQIQKLTKR